jgi:hypothetical protein
MSIWDSLCSCINLRADEVQATFGELTADEPTPSMSNRTQTSAPDAARSSGIGGWLAKVRSYFTDLSCGFCRSKESQSIPDARKRLPVNQAILAKNNAQRQQLLGAVLTGRFDLARNIKLALAGAGDRKLAFERITDTFNRMRGCGASLEEVQAGGEFNIDDDEALEFLEGLARTESAGDAPTPGVDVSKVVLTGTADITDERTLPRLERTSRLGVRLNKVKLTGTMGAKVTSLNFIGRMEILPSDVDLGKKQLQSILDLADNNPALTLANMTVGATFSSLVYDDKMLTLVKRARKLGASVDIGGRAEVDRRELDLLLKLGRARADISRIEMMSEMIVAEQDARDLHKMLMELSRKHHLNVERALRLLECWCS